MTIKRNFEMSDFEAEKLFDEAVTEMSLIDGVVVDEDDPEIAVDEDGVYYVKSYVRIK